MKTSISLCIASALLGATLAVIWTHPDNSPQLRAQDGRQRSASARANPRPAETRPMDLEGDFTPDERINIAVYEQTNRSVVHITTKTVVQDLFFESPREGSGSGSILDRQGHILTNYHVVEEARQIRVTLFDGSEFEAGLVGEDRLNDIAVLRIEAPPELLFPVTFGDSNRLRVGQRVYAIGNPFGLERTMTVGIISSLNRTLPSRQTRKMKAIIQIDAALNQGNSGGPLLDSHARLIGMNTAIASSTGENTGVGFSIPINTIARIVPQLIETGRVIRPDIGIAYMVATNKGLAVVSTVPGGPAERAGLRGFRIIRQKSRRGPFIVEETKIDKDHADLVLTVDGKELKNVDDFLSAVESRRPGEEVSLGILRQGQPVEVKITLGAAE